MVGPKDRRAVFGGAGILATLMTGIAALACNTPVYRYAMYNWRAAPYQVFYLTSGDVAEDKATAEALKANDDPAAPNIGYHATQTTNRKHFDALPEVVRKAGSEKLPTHVVVTPWETVLHKGQLSPKEVESLVQSPARRRIGEMLQEGMTAVFLVLVPPDKAKTEAVEKVVDGVIAQATMGKIAVGSEDPAISGETTPAPSAEGPVDEGHAARMRLKVGRLTLSRADPAEQWLVRSLLQVEPGLDEFANDALVYAVYGRGRVMPPFAAKGITEDNLKRGLAFLAGACSCVVKDENPGVDLLMGWNWNAVAMTLAAEDEQTDGGQAGYREVGMASEKTADRPAKPSDKEAPSNSPPAAASGDQAAAPKPAPPSSAIRATQEFADRQAWVYGLGIVVASVAVLALGRLVLRQRRD